MITIKGDDAVDELFTDLAAAFVDEAHLVGVVRNMADGYFLLGTNDETASLPLGLGNIFQLTVVHQMAFVQGTKEVGIFAKRQAHEWHQLVVLFLIAEGLGKDDHIATDALLLEIFQGDGVADASVEQFSALHMNHLGRQRHGC